MNTISLILMLLSAVSIGLCVYILARIKHVVYLLEQPVVKKISPEMKLKTVKVDDGEDSRRHNHRQSQGQNPGANGGRAPQGPKSEGPRDRNNRPEGQQGPRPERGGNDHRGHDRNRDRDRDRGPRQDRGDRGDRGERHERGERPERQRPRLDVFSNDKEAAPAPVEPTHHHESAPAHVERPALAPRRPLAANVDREEPVTSAPVNSQPELPADAIFVGDDGDMQHGRRTQLKKKPRFNIDEEEVKAEENKVQA